jgi:hypothetical protein
MGPVHCFQRIRLFRQYAKVAADQRGHAIGVAIDTYTESDLESRREAVTKLERALAGRKPVEREDEPESSAEPSFRGKRGKTA